MDLKNVTAYCGIDCFNCEIFEKNVTPDFQKHLSSVTNRKAEEITCKGCKISGCLLTDGNCETKSCIMKKNLDFCYECNDFPCSKLMPVREGADMYPHNIKLYNLCRMKKLGLEEWAKESKEIRQKYFKGKFEIGKGPVLD